MNIFATDKNPSIAAACLDDVRLREMLVESAQILCTAVSVLPTHIYDYEKSPLYKPTSLDKFDANRIEAGVYTSHLHHDSTSR